MNKIKNFPYKINDIITEEENKELEDNFGKIFCQNELVPFIKNEKELDEIENDIQDEIIEERNKKYRIVKI